MIHGLKPFWICIRNCREINVNDTAVPCAAESDFLTVYKTVCRIIRKDIRKNVGCTAVSMKPLWNAQRYQWHRCDMHSGVIDTAVTGTAVPLTPLCNQLCRLSSRIRSHIRKGFNPCIRGPGEVVKWKKQEVENLVSGSCHNKKFLQL
jgi:hypothetical protein